MGSHETSDFCKALALVGKAFAVKKMLKQMNFADIWIARQKPVFLPCSGNHVKSSIIIDLVDLPELVHHIVIGLTMFKRINLPRPRPGAKGAFRFMVNYFIARAKSPHFTTLSSPNIIVITNTYSADFLKIMVYSFKSDIGLHLM